MILFKKTNFDFHMIFMSFHEKEKLLEMIIKN